MPMTATASPRPTPPPNYLTIGQIARRLDVPVHRIRYAVEEYEIRPDIRVGILRAWREESLELISAALRRIAANRSGGGM